MIYNFGTLVIGMIVLLVLVITAVVVIVGVHICDVLSTIATSLIT